jgi:hypothetical protein
MTINPADAPAWFDDPVELGLTNQRTRNQDTYLRRGVLTEGPTDRDHTLRCDRDMDGAVGARFLSTFKSLVERPTTMIL